MNERLAHLETKVENLNKQIIVVNDNVWSLLTNHLPHVQAEIHDLRTDLTKEINKLRVEVARLSIKISVIVSIVSVVCNLIIGKFL